MQSMVRKAGLLALAVLLCNGCLGQREISRSGGAEGKGVADSRPCVANFSVEGSFFSGRVVKSFKEYPNSSKGATFTYLISKIASIGYKINASDKEAGLISASYQVTLGQGETTSLNAVVTERSPNGVRVDLTFTTGGMVSFRPDDAQKEFCSILEGVPSLASAPPPPQQVKEELPVAPPTPTPGPKPPATEAQAAAVSPSAAPAEAKVASKPVVAEKPPASFLILTKAGNIRSEPNAKSKIITTLKKGDKVEKLDKSGNWYKIKLGSGDTGWVFKDLVKEAE